MRRALAVALLLVVAAPACGGGDDDPRTVRLVTHDSFAASEDVFAAFTEQTGIEVEVIRAGDAGALVNQAVLSAGDPQGDVLYGIDTTFLTRGLDADLFAPYESPELANVADALEIDAEHRVTPIDSADVCLNIDRGFFAADGAPPTPTRLEDLTDPAYRDLLVVEDPATSSPGLAFLYATVATFGDDGWQAYWQGLRANGVAVADGWEDAYYGQFSGGGTSEGDRPIVVSYASSPPAEVVFADPPVDEPPTAVVEASCVRQVEYAGVLRGAAHEDEAHELIDFLLSARFQEDMPLQMFVFPVREGAALPDVFERFAVRPAEPIELDPFAIGATRDARIEEWTNLVLR